MNQRDQDLEELGRRLTEMIRTAETTIKLGLHLHTQTVMNNAVECKNLVNKLKRKETERQ